MSLGLWHIAANDPTTVIPASPSIPATEPTPISTATWQAGDLFDAHPPCWEDPRKQAVFQQVSSPGAAHHGIIGFRRWQAPGHLPGLSLRPTNARVVPGPFSYEASPPGTMEWHMNFADPSLFAFYRSSLFAQDEIQVVEHPALACVREAGKAHGENPATVDTRGNPTPCTITGVERRCAINFDPGDDLPDGLYGRQFEMANVQAVLARARPIRPPTISHILAMAAPACRTGLYTKSQLLAILLGAYAGFRAAALESACLTPTSLSTIIHTGLWGCGAFGGNPSVMVILQCMAADLAGVQLSIHACPTNRMGEIRLAISLALDLVRDRDGCWQSVIESMAQMKFPWGRSDGN